MPPHFCAGMGWYHAHVHGSVAMQVPTAAGPLITPESSLKSGLNKLYVPVNRSTTAECVRLVNVSPPASGGAHL